MTIFSIYHKNTSNRITIFHKNNLKFLVIKSDKNGSIHAPAAALSTPLPHCAAHWGVCLHTNAINIADRPGIYDNDDRNREGERERVRGRQTHSAVPQAQAVKIFKNIIIFDSDESRATFGPLKGSNEAVKCNNKLC